jgi:hypothetical protein
MEMGEIGWEDLRFTFRAPYRAFHKARERGVESILCRLARSVLQPGDMAIDVGANYGFVTLVMANSVIPGGRVFSFEIDPMVASTLADTIRDNDLERIVHLTKMGAGAVVENGMVTVDSIVDRSTAAPVRFLKVDTDGSDYEVLLGATEVLTTHHPLVVVEMHRDQQAIYELLSSLGYVFFIDLDGRPLVPGEWPNNLVASLSSVALPKRGAFLRANINYIDEQPLREAGQR